MIKIALGGKDVECSSREHISIVMILGGKGSFIFLSSDGKFGGESGLSDVFVAIKRDDSFYPVYSGIILCQPRHS